MGKADSAKPWRVFKECTVVDVYDASQREREARRDERCTGPQDECATLESLSHFFLIEKLFEGTDLVRFQFQKSILAAERKYE